MRRRCLDKGPQHVFAGAKAPAEVGPGRSRIRHGVNSCIGSEMVRVQAAQTQSAFVLFLHVKLDVTRP
jgi:hypothetical protein